MSIKENWDRIEHWLHINSPDYKLAKGTNENEIRKAEKYFDITFPAGFRESLKIHNGEKVEIWLFGDWSLLSLKYMIKMYNKEVEYLKEVEIMKAQGKEEYWEEVKEKTVKQQWWNKKWIPIAYDGSGGYLCLDFDPDIEGKQGQIIQTNCYGQRSRLALTFEHFLSLFVQDLESNKFTIEDDHITKI